MRAAPPQIGCGNRGVVLPADGGANVLSVEVDGDVVIFWEECDGHQYREMGKEDALEMLEEMKKWIRENA